MKEKIIDFISYFHLYDLILFSAFLLLAMCFIFLSFIFFRRKFISIPFFLLGFGIIIAIPFAIKYFMQERFYKIEKEITYDNTYNYSDVYQYIAEIKNVGRRNIAGCIFSHQILYDTDNEVGVTKYKHILLNYIKPKKVYTRDIPMDLKVGQSIKISEVMENYKHKGSKYITKIECYGKKRHKDDIKPLQGVYKPKKEEDKNVAGVKIDSVDSIDNNEIEIDGPDEFDVDIKSKTTDNTKTETKEEINKTQDLFILEDDNATQELHQESTPNDNMQPSQTNIPPTEETLPPNWRELRDNFNVPLLKETPR